MPRKRMTMRKIKEIYRLKLVCGLSHRQITASTGASKGTVGDYLLRAKTAGLTWAEIETMDEADLERLLFPSSRPSRASPPRPLPEWSEVRQELTGKGVTLALLWQEYKERYPEGYEYSRFCDLYRIFSGKLDVCMRQEHKAGEKLFVDYAGQTVDIVDAATGLIQEAQIFVAVLGASNYTYAEATWSQDLRDWVGSHCRAFDDLGGSTEILVPDNLKSGVTTPCRYDPVVNRTYEEMAAHYGTAVIPARVMKPRDKAKVEAGVLLVERWILACLRHQTFFSLAALNREIRRLLIRLNDKPLKLLKVSRRELYLRLDRPALKPLPAVRYVFSEWKKVRVSIDYHVEFERHYYSVPYQLVRKELDLRSTAETVECFHRDQRVASHRRSRDKGRHTTIREHMPKAHQEYLDWTPKRLVQWAAKTGGATEGVVEAILASRPHPQQGFRSCLGLLRLGKSYSPERLEAACHRALAIGSASYKSVQSILKNDLDSQPLPAPETPEAPPIEHPNIRGTLYYEAREKEIPSC